LVGAERARERDTRGEAKMLQKVAWGGAGNSTKRRQLSYYKHLVDWGNYYLKPWLPL